MKRSSSLNCYAKFWIINRECKEATTNLGLQFYSCSVGLGEDSSTFFSIVVAARRLVRVHMVRSARLPLMQTTGVVMSEPVCGAAKRANGRETVLEN